MKISNAIALCAILGLSIQLTSQTIDNATNMPANLKALLTQETALKSQLLGISNSTLQNKKIKIVLKIAQIKINRQTATNSTATPQQDWNKKIVITKAEIEGLQDLLQREKDPKLTPAKIYKDLKNEYLRLQQEPDSRNQSLES